MSPQFSALCLAAVCLATFCAVADGGFICISPCDSKTIAELKCDLTITEASCPPEVGEFNPQGNCECCAFCYKPLKQGDECLVNTYGYGPSRPRCGDHLRCVGPGFKSTCEDENTPDHTPSPPPGHKKQH